VGFSAEKYINLPQKSGFMDEEKEFEEVYDDEAREDLVENDEISAEEEGFMSGYEERKEKTKEDYVGDDAYEKSFVGREGGKGKRTAKPEKAPVKTPVKKAPVKKAPAKPQRGPRASATGKVKKK
jgi:hypothetical protein